MAKPIFRKVSLERLSSPEQLDQLMTVTSPKGWLALIALGMLVMVAVIWGIYGTIPTKVQGNGILIRSGGVYDIESETAGKVTSIYPNRGDVVKQGQITARVAQPDLIENINKAQAEIKELLEQKRRIEAFGATDIKMQKESIAQKKKLYRQSIENSEKQNRILKEQLENQKELFKEGLITKGSYLATQQEIDTNLQNINEYQNQLQLLEIQNLQLQEDKEQKQISIIQQIDQVRRNLDILERTLEKSSKVISPYSGIVLEVVVQEGAHILQGQPILRLERMGNTVGLEAVVYMSPDKGKQVKPGFEIQISPSTVKREEHGLMLGLITDVAQYPATQERMINMLQNSALVQTLSNGSAPIEIHADMIPSSRTYSGYKWSSSEGPPIKINSGTICFASVTVNKKAPIDMVIPMFKKYIMGIGEEE